MARSPARKRFIENVHFYQEGDPRNPPLCWLSNSHTAWVCMSAPWAGTAEPAKVDCVECLARLAQMAAETEKALITNGYETVRKHLEVRLQAAMLKTRNLRFTTVVQQQIDENLRTAVASMLPNAVDVRFYNNADGRTVRVRIEEAGPNGEALHFAATIEG